MPTAITGFAPSSHAWYWYACHSLSSTGPTFWKLAIPCGLLLPV